MTPLTVNYATPSVFESTRDRAMLGLSASSARPVRFHAKVAREIGGGIEARAIVRHLKLQAGIR